jgi:uncharacterized SAM-binding protein YcdF (DUF218 family)
MVLMWNVVKMIAVWTLAILFTVNSVSMALRAHYSTGHLLMYLCSLGLIIYGLFHRQIDAFTAHGPGRALKILTAAGLLVYGILFGFVAVSGYAGRARGDEKSIIILGAGLHGETVSDLLRRRLAAALDLWQANPEAVIVVTGGQGPGESLPEARAMERWLRERGVPEEKLIEEAQSTSTEENLLFARRLLQAEGIAPEAPTAVVTNAFHCYRARQYAAKLGFSEVRTEPASISPGVLLPSYLREVLAIMYMWMFRHGAIE